jgi:hypothetical protein
VSLDGSDKRGYALGIKQAQKDFGVIDWTFDAAWFITPADCYAE